MKKIMRLFLAFAIVPLLGSVSACSSPAAADAGTRTQDATSTTPDVAGQTAGENTGTGGVTTGGATAQGGSGGPMDASPTGGSSAPITTGRGDNRLRFDSGWRFHLGDVEGAEQPGFADTSWRELDLPHDWSIENPFDKSSPSGVGGGALAGGIGWYRKTFTLPPGAAGKQVLIWFDGVYMNSTVWVNGQSLGDHPYGYTSFFYDVTPALNATGSNVVAVKVNHRQPSSRWYSGSGIYRHVWLSFVDPVHFKPWGIFIFTRWVQGGFATVGAHVFVQNQTAVSQTVSVNMTVADDTGKVVSLLSQSASVEAGSESKLVFTGTVYQPRLWTLDQPVLYTATTELQLGDAIIETQKTPFGIRTFAFDAQQGFSLNGQAMKLHGLCMHHDLGALGAAINETAIKRQLQILKDMGANAIRTSHNPPAPELLDACDQIGLVVMDEAFDCWRTGKNSYDYHLYFDEWAERDLRSMVQRDRNHPSVILWSIGNEIPDAKSPAGTMVATRLIQWVRAEDDTRPVSDAESDIENSQAVAAQLDWVGINYQPATYATQHSSHPDWKVYGSETSSAVRSRGVFHAPADQSALTDSDLQCSSYDNSVVPWGASAEDSLRLDRNNAWFGGQFIWTGFDYLGEPTPYDWPAKSSYFGIVDTAGFPKDIYYFYLSQWSTKPTLHLLPHWNWPEGSTVTVFAYTNADSVEVTLNGRSLGSKSFTASREMKLSWEVPFEAGTLQAVGRNAGVVVATDQVVTAGAQAGVVLTSSRKELVAGGSDLLFVEANVVDGSGILVPDADTWMRFSVDGGAEIAAVDNGNPIDLDPYRAVERRAFSGKALAIVRAPKQAGEVTVRATAWAGDKDLAREKTASADSTASGHRASDALDGTTTTQWCAEDGASGHWWSVDLGAALDLVGTQITWETPGPSYNYVIDASLDGTTWTTVVASQSNARISQTQVDQFAARARYLRVTVTGVPPGWSACIEDFRAFGSEAVLRSNALVVAAR